MPTDSQPDSTQHFSSLSQSTTAQEWHFSQVSSDAPSSASNSDCKAPSTEYRANETVNDNDNHDNYNNENSCEYFCSILNTVVDHVMVDPNPLHESKEYNINRSKHKNNDSKNSTGRIQVPVMRIFGPIVKRCTNNNNDTSLSSSYPMPVQSACLHIHGVFPYLLCRPVVAGLDGSGIGILYENDDTHVNWDSYEQVHAILPTLHNILEATMQSSIEDFGGRKPDGESQQQEKTNRNDNNATPVIRRLTVVMGRGFYTYCSGPPAPFIRVEYYHPSSRWQVKRILERGLDTTSYYHPNREQYSYTDNSSSLLQFHCYEAHIPYTMQFFKDYNLAGMSYIHIGNCKTNDSQSFIKFRKPLPRTRRIRNFPTPDEATESVPDDALFLADNTSEMYIWSDGMKWNYDNHLSSNSSTTAYSPENEEETHVSKTIEQAERVNDSTFASVFNLTPADPNARAVTTAGDEHNEEFITKNNVQISNKNKFLSSPKDTTCDVEIDVHVSNILNVHSVITHPPSPPSSSENGTVERCYWRAVPSLRELWVQERRRMKRLLQPQHDFLSHPSRDDASEQANAELNVPTPFTLDVKTNASVPGAKLALQGMQSLVRVTDNLETDFQRVARDIVTKHKDRIDFIDSALKQKRLQSMITTQNRERYNISNYLQTPQSASLSAHNSMQTPTNEEVLDAFIALPLLENKEFNVSNDIDSQSPGGSESFVFQTPDRKLNRRVTSSAHNQYDSTTVDANITQPRRSPEEHFHEMSQSCYKLRIKNRNEMDAREYFEMSQRIDRGDCIVDGPFNHAEDFLDPETLCPYEMNDDEGNEEYDTDLPETDGADGTSVDEMLYNDKHDHNLPHRALEFDHDTTQEQSEMQRNPTQKMLEAQLKDVVKSTLDKQHIYPNDDIDRNNSPDYSYDDIGMHGDSDWSCKANSSVMLSRSALNRRQAATGHLLPIYRTQDVPDWLPNASQCNQYTKSSVGSDWFPTVPPTGTSAEVLKRPPSRNTVNDWLDSQSTAQLCVENSAITEKYTGNKKLKVTDNLNRKSAQGTKSTTSSAEKLQSCVSEKHNENKPRAAHDANKSVTTKKHQDIVPTVEAVEKALDGIGNQGGRLRLDGGGELKAEIKPHSLESTSNPNTKTVQENERYIPAPVLLMCVEIHVQCRIGKSGVNNTNNIALTPDPERDVVCAVMYVIARDPGGGESLQLLEHGCVLTPVEKELADIDREDNTSLTLSKMSRQLCMALPKKVLGKRSLPYVCYVKNEKELLLRFSSLVHAKDPDVLLSWDPQGAGLGYLIERGALLGDPKSNGDDGVSCAYLDMAQLLGRCRKMKNDSETLLETPIHIDNILMAMAASNTKKDSSDKSMKERLSEMWKGSGMGREWDDRVGPGVAAASIKGRLVFSSWKIVSEELKHPNASYLQAVVSNVLNIRIPYHDRLRLNQWYSDCNGRERWRVVHHRFAEAMASLLLFDAMDIVGRAGEAARLSGVEFLHSFPGIRGSQYKVEGVLLRALQSLNANERGAKSGRRIGTNNDKTKTDNALKFSRDSTSSNSDSLWKGRRVNAFEDSTVVRSLDDRPAHQHSDYCYFFFSPSIDDTNKQEALEAQAMTLEPKSGHQVDPVVVFDFTALYPSLVIAYNLCYSTCAGKVDYHSSRAEMQRKGATTEKVGPVHYPEIKSATVLQHHIKSIDGVNENSVGNMDRAYLSPNGAIFVSEAVTKGVLPQVLDEMLSTRAMLKKAAKQYKKHVPNLSSSVLRQLEARQLALKYVANVTYGYTSATFSGRCAMPILADTIVECGRRTLTNAISIAKQWSTDSKSRWYGCEVIYGDTDSIFIKLPGRTVQESFEFGSEFCDAVTSNNPPPVQLKLEKVYLGSMMQTKKKYCGLKYESPYQSKPVFEAKGIETVRRDQCKLTQTILRDALVTLFQYGVQQVREYLYYQWTQIMAGNIPVSDFILTGQVRSKYRGGVIGPVQAALSRRLAEADPGRIIRHKERLAYVIVATPGKNFVLRNSALTPIELLEQWDTYTIHTDYYITRHLNAALDRCLVLQPYCIDVNEWYKTCPKPRKRIHYWPKTKNDNKTMISSYFGSDICAICHTKCKVSSISRVAVCSDCTKNSVAAFATALRRYASIQNQGQKLAQTCSRCNACFEDYTTFGVTKQQTKSKQRIKDELSQVLVKPLANCSCIDCPTTYDRHTVRERQLEIDALLGILPNESNK